MGDLGGIGLGLGGDVDGFAFLLRGGALLHLDVLLLLRCLLFTELSERFLPAGVRERKRGRAGVRERGGGGGEGGREGGGGLLALPDLQSLPRISGFRMRVGPAGKAVSFHQPSEGEQIFFLNCLDLYHTAPCCGARQYKLRARKRQLDPALSQVFLKAGGS